MDDNSFRIGDVVVVNNDTDKYDSRFGKIVSITSNKETGENVYYCKDQEYSGIHWWVQHSENITLAR